MPTLVDAIPLCLPPQLDLVVQTRQDLCALGPYKGATIRHELYRPSIHGYLWRPLGIIIVYFVDDHTFKEEAQTLLTSC